MALTITKTTAGRIAVNDGVNKAYYPLQSLRLSCNGDLVRLFFDAGPTATIISEDFTKFTLTHTSVGNATYDETGGAIEDMWTKATHGLSVGQSVIFTAVGTGAVGYAVNTRYYVASAPTANTFTLSATLGGAAISGTGDSVGTWTLAKYDAQDTIDVIEATL